MSRRGIGAIVLGLHGRARPPVPEDVAAHTIAAFPTGEANPTNETARPSGR